MNPILIFLAGWMVAMLNVSEGWCHGVEGTVEPIMGYCLTAMYDDGEPMSYAGVEIKAPNSDIAFQTGRTDRNGCFMVKTDSSGAWRAAVSDGMGHRLTLDFAVGADGDGQKSDQSTAPATSGGTSRPIRVVAALSIIFGLCGFFYGWKARRKDSYVGQVAQ
ncbi:hypothetical protein [uncultured Desulfosarcina sp.]|uniref:hypothetical protein n=1 Tax=uncultured Desulfosarcina sp. TaxID=218289 RepID=UPI0029C778BD|nr:hypothetical protein [uncultured Desulfosarcina sp.]